MRVRELTVQGCHSKYLQRRLRKAAMVLAGQTATDIRLITCDVDGTLLNSKQELTAGVENAVRLARSVGVPVSTSCPIM